MNPADVDAVLGVQEPGAVRAMSAIFPQDSHPFPHAELRARWLSEIADPETSCYVIEANGSVAGFAASRGDELLHFGTAVETWGTGLASEAHDELVGFLARRGTARAFLWVFMDNARARRFYERRGWHEVAESKRSTFPPHAVLLRYERDLVGSSGG